MFVLAPSGVRFGIFRFTLCSEVEMRGFLYIICSGLLISFSASQTVPCTTCTESNSERCCSSYQRCCDNNAIASKGTCPRFPGGRCSYKCIEDRQCKNDEKCCSQDGKFPRVCLVSSGSCPKSIAKSLDLKSCEEISDCTDKEMCCRDARKSGCCLKYINSSAPIIDISTTEITTQPETTTTTTTTPVTTTRTTTARETTTNPTTKATAEYKDEWVINE